MVQPLWKTVWWLINELNTELPHDPEIPPFIYPKELKTGFQTKSYIYKYSEQHYSQKPNGGNIPNVHKLISR